MTLFSSTINEILPFIPPEIHSKTIEVFNRIPGSLLKYFDPKPISKKAECGEHKLPKQYGLSHRTGEGDWRESPRDVSDTISKKLHVHEGTQRSLSLRSKSSAKETPFNSELWFNGHNFEYNREWNNLRSQLRDAIKKIFRERNISEVSAGKLAREIATKCLEQSPHWGRNHQSASAIVRFNNTYITDDPLVKINMHVYVYAHLICEHESSLLFRNQYKTSFDLTIELNGISIDPIKLSQFCRLLAENSVADSIKAIEGIVTLTWDDLNGPHSNRSGEKKLALTWEDF